MTASPRCHVETYRSGDQMRRSAHLTLYQNHQALASYLEGISVKSAATKHALEQCRQAPKLHQPWLIDPQLNPLPHHENYQVRRWHTVVREPQRFPGTIPPVKLRVMAALVTLRRVRGEYQLVTLRIMHAMAKEAGVPLDFIDDNDPKYKLPVDLRPIHGKLLAYAKGGGEGALPLTIEDDQWLSRCYLHQSADWTPSSWKPVYEAQSTGPTRVTLPAAQSGAMKVLFPLRPAKNRERLVFDQRKGH